MKEHQRTDYAWHRISLGTNNPVEVIGEVARVLHLGHDESASDEITYRASGGVGSISGTKDC